MKNKTIKLSEIRIIDLSDKETRKNFYKKIAIIVGLLVLFYILWLWWLL